MDSDSSNVLLFLCLCAFNVHPSWVEMLLFDAELVRKKREANLKEGGKQKSEKKNLRRLQEHQQQQQQQIET